MIFATLIISFIIISSYVIMIKNSQWYLELIMTLKLSPPSLPYITSGYIYDNFTIFINVTMQGTKGIPIRNLNLSDVFVVYKHQGNIISIKIDSWYPTRVFTNGKEGDIVNPIEISKWNGIWDPGEMLELKFSLPYPMDEFRVFLLMIMPDGGVCSCQL